MRKWVSPNARVGFKAILKAKSRGEHPELHHYDPDLEVRGWFALFTSRTCVVSLPMPSSVQMA